MKNKIFGSESDGIDSGKLDKEKAAVDPSNTSDIGERVEQGVIDTKEGISEQSSEWEDKLERNLPDNSSLSENPTTNQKID